MKIVFEGQLLVKFGESTYIYSYVYTFGQDSYSKTSSLLQPKYAHCYNST